MPCTPPSRLGTPRFFRVFRRCTRIPIANDHLDPDTGLVHDQTEPAPPAQQTLETWKEIAAHLRRDVTTVRRWEKREGLPVHRHQHDSGVSVYAFPGELDAWRRNRRLAGVKPSSTRASIARRVAVAIAFAAAAAVVLKGPILDPPNPSASADDGLQAERLFAGADIETFGSVSPDGQWATFTDWSSGDLAVKDLESTQTRRLTTKNSWDVNGSFTMNAVVSPSRTTVAYNWMLPNGNWELRVVGWEGGPGKKIAGGSETPWIQPMAWAPDGSQIAVWASYDQTRKNLSLVTPDGSSNRVLKELDAAPSAVRFSPDGGQIALSVPAQNFEKHDIFFLSIADGTTTKVLDHPADDRFVAWVPDGRGVLFLSDRRRPDFDLWWLPDLESNDRPRIVHRSIGLVQPLGITAAGELYYQPSQSSLQDLYSVEIDPKSGKVFGGPEPVLTSPVGKTRRGDWSPDGSKIAFVVQDGYDVRPGWRTLWLYDVSTGRTNQVLMDLYGASTPSWSPDGRKLLVWGVDRDLRKGFYIFDIESRTVTNVVAEEPQEAISGRALWDASGDSIYYGVIGFEEPRGLNIFRQSLAGGVRESVYRKNGRLLVPSIAISRDGSLIAVGASRSNPGDWEVSVVPTAGGQSRVLVRLEIA